MADIVNCNDEQASQILKRYFGKKPTVVRLSKNDGIYFFTFKTTPGNFKATCQYRAALNNYANACFISIYKNVRRYDLNGNYPKELLTVLNETCKEAVNAYELDCDLFDSNLEEPTGLCREVTYTFHQPQPQSKNELSPIAICSIVTICMSIIFGCIYFACTI